MPPLIALGTAFWLGVLTSISPCPLATNIAAISFTSRKIGSVSRVLGAGLLYTLGRMTAYALLGFALVQGLLAAPAISHLLQKYLNLLMGPLLILVAMVLLDLLDFKPRRGTAVGAGMQARVEKAGLAGAFLLGFVFALAMCPVSAAIFFGSLLPLALQSGSGLLLPSVYGIATGLPVLAFALLLAFGANRVGRAYDQLARFECWAQRVTGAVFLAVGLYMTVVATLGVKV